MVDMAVADATPQQMALLTLAHSHPAELTGLLVHGVRSDRHAHRAEQAQAIADKACPLRSVPAHLHACWQPDALASITRIAVSACHVLPHRQGRSNTRWLCPPTARLAHARASL